MEIGPAVSENTGGEGGGAFSIFLFPVGEDGSTTAYSVYIIQVGTFPLIFFSTLTKCSNMNDECSEGCLLNGRTRGTKDETFYRPIGRSVLLKTDCFPERRMIGVHESLDVICQ